MQIVWAKTRAGITDNAITENIKMTCPQIFIIDNRKLQVTRVLNLQCITLVAPLSFVLQYSRVYEFFVKIGIL